MRNPTQAMGTRIGTGGALDKMLSGVKINKGLAQKRFPSPIGDMNRLYYEKLKKPDEVHKGFYDVPCG